ncbi:hypothetical protein Pan216_50400 [Planctomycetes bacterium Pan216]|uniref:Inverse autotransporter beta-domain domain-containing protein n=1 Tax=Kolteria novifilia TaxID=2527975 RepID=A0A518BAZ0_9BACT|nr:hypothetical protein Pan216_50400 [Planctomycetes bacterium Pan216]
MRDDRRQPRSLSSAAQGVAAKARSSRYSLSGALVLLLHFAPLVHAQGVIDVLPRTAAIKQSHWNGGVPATDGGLQQASFQSVPSGSQQGGVRLADYQTSATNPTSSGIQQTSHLYHGGPGLNDGLDGYDALYQPTPVANTLQGNPNLTTSTNSTNGLAGPRLDTTYNFLRDTQFYGFIEEEQTLIMAGGTLLPIQTPCVIFGTQGLFGYAGNDTRYNDSLEFSIDSYLGWRYKTVYMKLDAFIDWEEEYQKVGGAVSAMANLPLVRVMTLDLAIASGLGADSFGPQRGGIRNQLKRVQTASVDYQIYVGKYFCPFWQLGWSGRYLTYDDTLDETYGGLFTNLYLGRFRFGGEVVGGTGGLRGFVTAAVNWGVPPKRHPMDRHYNGVDTIGWVTQAPIRNHSIEIRDSFTGPPTPLP